MNAEIFGALRLLEKERGISMDFMLEKINKAIITACKNTYDGNEDVVVSIDEENGIFEVDLLKTVTEEVEFPGKEISLEDAIEIYKNAEIGSQVTVNLNTKQCGRIEAQDARNTIR